MGEAAEQIASVYNALVILAKDGQLGRRVWRLQQQRPVGTVAVVVLDVDPKDLLEVAASDDQQPVQTLGPDRPHPALGVRVRRGCPHRRAEHLATVRAEDLVETAAELGVPVVDKEAHLPAPLAQDQQEVAGLLGDPAAVRVGLNPWRRRTVNWWRSARTSRSLAASPRASSTSACMERHTARYASFDSTRDGLRRVDRGEAYRAAVRHEPPGHRSRPSMCTLQGDRRHHEELGLRRVKPNVQPVCAFHVGLLATTPSWRSARYANGPP
jgi:hypothetical protein